MIQSFNNKTDKVGDDFKENICKESKLQVAAGIFSIYGFEALKAELKKIESLNFIFTDPTFIELDKKNREQRQFHLNSNTRQKSIGGSEFEINLKNELKGKAIAKECKKWIEQKVTFKTNAGNKYIQPHVTLLNKDRNFVYMGINEFSSAGFGYEKDNSILHQIIKTDDFDTTKQYIQNFNDIKKTRKGKIFYGCTNFPKCKYALWDKPTGEKCSVCDELLVEKNNKVICLNCNKDK